MMEDNRPTILIVDDEPINIQKLSIILEADYDLLVTTRGEQAIEIAIRQQPDLILLDIIMPDLDGYTVCENLRNTFETAKIPIIFVSGQADDSDEEYGFRMGAVDYIKKPFKPALVKARVRAQVTLRAHEKMLQKFNETLLEQVEIEVAERLEAQNKIRSQEKLLIQQSKMAEMGEMIGIIAHQWKQPINAIYLIAQEITALVEYDEMNIEEANHVSKSIMEQAAFMNETIDDFRNYFKPSREKAAFGLDHALQEVLKILGPHLQQSRIELISDVDTSLKVTGLKNELKQVILNILNNARDALNASGANPKKIIVRILKRDGLGCFEIEDNAGGIPPEILDQIFSQYFSTKGDTGTGIGLSLSKMIVEENMGGTLSVSNTDKGACFAMKLPLDTLNT